LSKLFFWNWLDFSFYLLVSLSQKESFNFTKNNDINDSQLERNQALIATP
jgi:hypothetical protein